MIRSSFILALLLPFSAVAETVLHATNEVGMIQAVHSQTASEGTIRANVRVTEPDAVTGLPVNKDMSDIETFVAEAKDIRDGRIVDTAVQDTTGDQNDASVGQLRFILNLDQGSYDVRAYAVANETNYNVYWSSLTVTSAQSSGLSLSLDIKSFTAETITAERIIVDDLDVSGAIAAIDSNAVHTYDIAWSNVQVVASNAFTNVVSAGSGSVVTQVTFNASGEIIEQRGSVAGGTSAIWSDDGSIIEPTNSGANVRMAFAGSDTFGGTTDYSVMIATGGSSPDNVTPDNSGIIGSVGGNNLSGSGQNVWLLGGRVSKIEGSAWCTVQVGGFYGGNNFSVIDSQGSFLGIPYKSTNYSESATTFGHYVLNRHRGSFLYGDKVGTSWRETAKTNSAVWFVHNGFGINTNNPQQALDVQGDVFISGGKIYSGTNVIDLQAGTYNGNAL